MDEKQLAKWGVKHPCNYGCVKCQVRHYSGEPLFDDHINFQSKHGFMHSASNEPYRPDILRAELRDDNE